MNFNLTQIPERNKKPRTHGITMVMDKGLSVEEAKNFMSIAEPHVDIVKLGFGTSFVTPICGRNWTYMHHTISRFTLAELYLKHF